MKPNKININSQENAYAALHRAAVSFISLILLISMSLCSFAQDTEAKVIKELKALAARYTGDVPIRFDVRYRYAASEQPTVYLDSLHGNCILSGSRFLYEIGGTRMLYNGEYSLAIYPEDRIIYFSKAKQTNTGLDVLTAIDSLLRSRSFSYKYLETPELKILQLDLADDPQLKQLRYEIDRRTGFVSRVIQIVNADQLYGDEAAGGTAEKDRWAIVEAVFDGYSKHKEKEDVFNLDRYFVRENGRYAPQPPYQSYRVFSGSPEL